MLAIEHPANFVSAMARLPGLETSLLATPANDAGNYSAQLTFVMRSAQSAYSTRRYQDAVDAYKQALSLIFRLLQPRHPTERFVADHTMMLPVGPELEAGLAEASLKLAEALQPAAGAPHLPIAPTAVKLPAELLGLDGIGFSMDGDVPQKARDALALGSSLLADGQGRQAAEVLQDAVSALGQPASQQAREMAAAAALNLSSAQILAGDQAGAQSTAQSAANLFQALGDTAGRAQATHNRAVALGRAGLADQSKQAFDAAAALAAPLAQGAASSSPTAQPGPILDRTGIRLRAGGALSAVAAATSSAALSFIANRDDSTLSLRLSGGIGGGAASATLSLAAAASQAATWAWQVGPAHIQWKNGQRPAGQVLLDSVYKPRVTETNLLELAVRPSGASGLTPHLTHLYSFVIPQALGDSYSALGDYARAETYYLQAAQYRYINTRLEAPALWIRLANNALAWGDALYKQELIEECRPIYSKLVTQDATAPTDSPLYTLAVFAGPSADANRLIANLAAPRAANVNPALAAPVLLAWARWRHITAGLDYFGTSFSPIFTFEYLQQVASTYAQQAVQAERAYVDFQSRAEAEAATRRDLEAAAQLADAAVSSQDALQQSADAEVAAMNDSVDLAKLRAQQASADHDAYSAAGYAQYIYQSIATAHGAHSDWHEQDIRRLAADMEAGSWSGDSGQLAAAATLLGGQASYEYQLQRLQDTAAEMQATVPVAQAQADAASHRADAARLQLEAAQQRADLAHDGLAAFDNEVFTPDTWAQMGLAMRDLSHSYQEWAIRIAKLMERAYNFENDDNLAVIRNDYPGLPDAAGLLGSDYLLRDIDSFTQALITRQRARQSQLKDVISLANQYPFDFYRFQQTGDLAFETTLDEADLRHPGFYGQRLTAVEVEVVGLLPPGGVLGTLRGGGVSRYRTPDGGQKTRIHATDTLALSEYSLRDDALVFRQDPRLRGLFEGEGIASTWRLDLPRRSNNFDYRLLTDVRLVLYYAAAYDPALRNTVLNRPPKPGGMTHVRTFLARYDFPESWYAMLDTGSLQFTITPPYLPRNETGFRTDKVALRLLAADGVSAAGVSITLTPPGRQPVTAVTDGDGQVATVAGSPLLPAVGGDLLGAWRLDLKPPAGSKLLGADGKLDGDALDQVVLIAQYQFSWP
jgi:Tc toxin complex TcA C-terminal TcB-binding domain